MKNQNQINDTNKSESEEIIKDIADFETLLEMNRNDKNSPEVSILRVAAFWSGTFSRQNLSDRLFIYRPSLDKGSQ